MPVAAAVNVAAAPAVTVTFEGLAVIAGRTPAAGFTVTVSVEVAVAEPVVEGGRRVRNAGVGAVTRNGGCQGDTCGGGDAAIGPGFVQVTTGAALAQVQFAPTAETNVRPVGSESVTVIAPVVAATPALLTARVKTPFCPAVKFPAWLLAMESSGPEGGFTVIGVSGRTTSGDRVARAGDSGCVADAARDGGRERYDPAKQCWCFPPPDAAIPA